MYDRIDKVRLPLDKGLMLWAVGVIGGIAIVAFAIFVATGGSAADIPMLLNAAFR